MTGASALVVAVLCAALSTSPAAAEPAGRITGMGGLFLKSKGPKALMAWYRDVLGIKLESWGGAVLPYDAPQHPPAVIFNAFPPFRSRATIWHRRRASS